MSCISFLFMVVLFSTPQWKGCPLYTVRIYVSSFRSLTSVSERLGFSFMSMVTLWNLRNPGWCCVWLNPWLCHGVGERGMAVFLGNPEVKTFIVDRRIGSNISKGSSQCPIFSHLFLEWDLSVLHSNCLSSTQELSQWAHPLCRMLVFLLSTLQQGSPSPGSVPRVLVRNWVAPQRVKSRCVSEASSVFTAVPLHSLHHLSSTSFQISSIIRLSQEHGP